MTLRDFANMALGNNLGAIESGQNAQIARGQRLLALSNPLPQVSAGGSENFTRNIGQSVGTSAVTTLLARRGQYHQSVLAEYTRSHRFDAAVAGLTNRLTHVGLNMHSAHQQALARIYSVVMAQAQALSYVEIY